MDFMKLCFKVHTWAAFKYNCTLILFDLHTHCWPEDYTDGLFSQLSSSDKTADVPVLPHSLLEEISHPGCYSSWHSIVR